MTLRFTEIREAPPWYQHPIGGGWDVRHAGCANECCEDDAQPIHRLGFPEDATACGGCGGALGEPRLSMGFDRFETCETHA